MKEVLKFREVLAAGKDGLNPGTLPAPGKLVMLGMKKRDMLPPPNYFVPVIVNDNESFSFVSDHMRQPIAFVPGDMWWEIPRNPNFVKMTDEEVKQMTEEAERIVARRRLTEGLVSEPGKILV